MFVLLEKQRNMCTKDIKKTCNYFFVMCKCMHSNLKVGKAYDKPKMFSVK